MTSGHRRGLADAAGSGSDFCGAQAVVHRAVMVIVRADTDQLIVAAFALTHIAGTGSGEIE